VLSGFDLRRFAFEGFPPRSAGDRRAAFRAALARAEPTIWYESPHRIRATLADLASVEPAAQVFLLREFTKLHEQQLAGAPAAVAEALADPVRGEIVFVLGAGATASSAVPAQTQGIDAAIETLVEQGLSTSAIAKALAERGLGERRHLYARVTERRRAGPTATEA
jgi:16S rRNA (cytidine1402-2'-O)-methyltransferase